MTCDICHRSAEQVLCDVCAEAVLRAIRAQYQIDVIPKKTVTENTAEKEYGAGWWK